MQLSLTGEPVLVYGDQEHTQSTEEIHSILSRIGDQIEAIEPGIDRHHHVTDLLIRSGGLAQAILDRAFFDRGRIDDWGDLEECTKQFLSHSALLFIESLKHCPRLRIGAFREALGSLLELPHPGTLQIKSPEGFAFYCLYPETMLIAAERMRREIGNETDVVVIGIRSIGTVLSALVGSSTRARFVVTVRPTGPAFQRKIRISPCLKKALIRSAESSVYAIVDEGPGLSGSSFISVVDWLIENGITKERIHLFPSHSGCPGAFSSDHIQNLWSQISKQVVDFDFLRRQKIPCWPLREFKDAREISAGAWRELTHSGHNPWPPSDCPKERRKYLRDGILMKFAGLGHHSEVKRRIAGPLSDVGFTPKVLELRNGWLIQEWKLGRPLDTVTNRPAKLCQRLAQYIAFRSREFLSPPELTGADCSTLLGMMVQNIHEKLGPKTAKHVQIEFESTTNALQSQCSPILVDARMHAWEWLETKEGELLKCDAVDHAMAHDLIGPQDAAWDIAGALIEFDLNESESAEFLTLLEREGIRRGPELLRFFTLAYLAFQMGAATLAAQASQLNPADRGRHSLLAGRYAHKISILSRK